MTQMQDPISPPSPKPRDDSASPSYLAISVVVVAWLLIIVGGYYVGKLYIDNSIEAAQQTNAVHVLAMQNQLDSMASEIDQIKMVLLNADQTLATSGTTQQNLNQKIEALDEQLQALAQSLAILKEAP